MPNNTLHTYEMARADAGHFEGEGERSAWIDDGKSEA